MTQGSSVAVGPDVRGRLWAIAPYDAKVQAPRVRPGLVSRPAVLDRIGTDASVVVVCAPAGYGKTVLLAQWAEADPRPFAWLSVTETDNDLFVLAAYLARALDAIEPVPPETLTSLSMPGTDPALLLARLGRALQARTRPFVLVLDDVHRLESHAGSRLLTVLASHLPTGTQLALASRVPPPLPLARMRAEGSLSELGVGELAVNLRDGGRLLAGAGVELDEAGVDALVLRTEGWAAALYLAALALRDRPDPAVGAAGFSGTDHGIAEYVRTELLRALREEQVEFLTRSSVCEWLSGPDCDEILERDGSALMLEELARSNLLVVPLDAVGERYRYHHLFRELLHAELHRREPVLEARLHARASARYAEEGHPEPAIRHARLAGDTERAAALAWISAPAFLGSGRTETVARWLRPFTYDEIAAHPPLALAVAWCCVTARSDQHLAEWIELAARGDPNELLPDGSPLGAAVALLEAVDGSAGVARSAELAAGAYPRFPRPGWPPSIARYVEGTCRWLLGDTNAAEPLLREAVMLGALVPGIAAGSLAQLALIALEAGDPATAATTIDRARALVARHGLAEQPPVAIVLAVSALIHARHGDAELARRDTLRARRGLSRLGHLAPWLSLETQIVIARTQRALGDHDATALVVDEAREIADRGGDLGRLPAMLRTVATVSLEPSPGARPRAVPLTTAELRVLTFLPTHLSFQAMASELYVSRNTVKTQAISIYRKLGVSSRGDAVTRARELGLLDP